jgi:hypothetical protein
LRVIWWYHRVYNTDGRDLGICGPLAYMAH